jgi:carboxylesterase type B
MGSLGALLCRLSATAGLLLAGGQAAVQAVTSPVLGPLPGGEDSGWGAGGGSAGDSAGADAGLVKETSSGPIRGFTFFRDGGKRIDAWRGVPYAAPPIGGLRWERPQSPAPWAAPLECTAFGSMCMQPDGSGAEDCLSLNVYTSPAPGPAAGPLPVLFYIHGGSLMWGSGEYDMTAFVADAAEGAGGVVLVEINYRLNIFGFLAAQELTEASDYNTSGNYGILDQQLALRWVQENIHQFNGDPSRVTLMGQSSGGTSIFALLASPLSAGLFSAAISLSGSPNITMSLSQAHAQNRDIIVSSGCAGSPASASARARAAHTVGCLRALSAAQVAALVPAAWGTPRIWDLPPDPSGQHFSGLPVVDGSVLAAAFDEALARGVVDVPVLLGNTAQEPDLCPERDLTGHSLGEWKLALVDNFKDYENGAQIASDIYAIYAKDAEEDVQKAFDSFVSDYGVTCPALAVASTVYGSHNRSRSRQRQAMEKQPRKAPLYVFFNEWALSHPYSLPDSSYQIRYAYHTIDLCVFTRNWGELGDDYTPMPIDYEMSAFLQKLFYDFMSTKGMGVVGLEPVQRYGEQDYSVYVVSAGSGSGTGAGGGSMVTNFKKDVCSYFEYAKIAGKEFWWVN